MSLTKTEKVDQIEVVGDYKFVQVRTLVIIEDNGVEVSRNYSRHTIAAGEDYSDQNAEVQSICNLVHTPEVVAAYAAYVAS